MGSLQVAPVRVALKEVPRVKGDVTFRKVFDRLKKAKYGGGFILLEERQPRVYVGAHDFARSVESIFGEDRMAEAAGRPIKELLALEEVRNTSVVALDLPQGVRLHGEASISLLSTNTKRAVWVCPSGHESFDYGNGNCRHAHAPEEPKALRLQQS